MKTLRGDARVIVTSSFGTVLAISEPDGETVYGAEDWSDECAPSFAFDADGDLRQHNGSRCYGPAIEFTEGTSADLSDWSDTDGIFVDV